MARGFGTCIVAPDEGGPRRTTSKRKLSNRDKLALDALANCEAKPAPPELKLPTGQMVIGIEQWRDEMFARGILDRKASNPRTDFKRLKDGLQAKSLIGVRNDIVWSAANG